MSRSGRITLDFGDGTYVFFLGWGELTELQEKCDAGPLVLYHRLFDGTWRAGDVSHAVRLGLIGGGLEPIKALRLVQNYVEARPLLESLPVAQGVIAAALIGAPDEEERKKDEAADQSGSTISPTERSDSPPSSGSEPPSASHRKRSRASRTGSTSLRSTATSKRTTPSKSTS
ncbi:MAG: gene transfer agent family protein [Parvibaculaceae bacterium]